MILNVSRKIPFPILALAALKFTLPFLLQNPVYELHRDEYLYYQQGLHWDFGFLENPPMIGVLAWVSSLAGGSFFWIKFWPALFGALTVLLTASIAKELGGRLFAQIMAALGILLTAYLRIHFLFQPNFLEIFFWTAAVWLLVRFIDTTEDKYLYLLTAALAFAWWSKYSALFFIAALLFSVLLTPYRKWMARKQFWLAAGLGILLVTPNILWQYFHHWPLLHHMEELKETQLKYINKADFIKEQFLLLLPFAFVWIGGLVWLIRNNKYRIIGFIFIGVVLLVMFGSGKGYYTLGVYPMLLAAGGVWLEKISLKRNWLRVSALAFVVLIALPFVPVLLPIQAPRAMAESNKKFRLDKIGILKWEDQKNHPLQQDFADMLGWKELTEKAERFFNTLPDSTKTKTIIYCRNYGQAGALKYYGKDPYFRRKIISDNGSFLLWIPDRIWFRHLLFVGSRMPGSDDEVFNYFEKRTVIDSVTNPLSRQFGDKIIYFENGSDTASKLAAKGLKEMKAEFGE